MMDEETIRMESLNEFTIPQMAEQVQGHITDALLIMDCILTEAEPQTEDAKQCIAMVGDFNEILSRAWNRVENSVNEIIS